MRFLLAVINPWFLLELIIRLSIINEPSMSMFICEQLLKSKQKDTVL